VSEVVLVWVIALFCLGALLAAAVLMVVFAHALTAGLHRWWPSPMSTEPAAPRGV
jgi:hypothetical protein